MLQGSVHTAEGGPAAAREWKGLRQTQLPVQGRGTPHIALLLQLVEAPAQPGKCIHFQGRRSFPKYGCFSTLKEHGYIELNVNSMWGDALPLHQRLVTFEVLHLLMSPPAMTAAYMSTLLCSCRSGSSLSSSGPLVQTSWKWWTRFACLPQGSTPATQK